MAQIWKKRVTDIDELEMLRRLHRGEQTGLEELIERYTPYVSAILARILPGRREEWEELAADVFLAAWDHRKKLQPGRVKGWLATVARNRAFNRLRTLRENLPLEEELLTLTAEGPERELEEQELTGLVRAALEGLDREDRELFVRHYYYGQTVAKAAEEMELNLSTAKTRLRRGRARLKEELRKVGYEFETD